jgi:uncharacterized DUF497 family protein
MFINEIIWKEQFIDKIEKKHNVSTDEVEQIIFSNSHVRFTEKGKIKGENLYVTYGQTKNGRYIVVFFIYKRNKTVMPISARDMSISERRYYEKQKKSN